MEPSQDTILQKPKPQKPKPQKLSNHHQEEEEQESVHHQTEVEGEEEEEEALSLRDLPLNTDQTAAAAAAAAASASDHHDPAAEIFEFLSSASCDVSPAENIIFRGKLIPLNEQNAIRFDENNDNNVYTNISPRIRVRSESLSALQAHKLSRSSSVPRVMRNSHSLDYRKLTCASSNDTSPPEQDRKSPEKSTAGKASDSASFGGKSVRPRWYVIMFGMVKFPPEIELRDIKIRQTRRNLPPVMFPYSGDRIPVKSPSSSPSSSWRFLKALSCKEPTSVAATAPFWVPHA